MKEEQLNGDCPSRRRRKAEILCHNFHVICASRMGSREGTRGKSARADGVREHYAKADHVQWRRERMKERGNLRLSLPATRLPCPPDLLPMKTMSLAAVR
jgi:hypothetical protein